MLRRLKIAALIGLAAGVMLAVFSVWRLPWEKLIERLRNPLAREGGDNDPRCDSKIFTSFDCLMRDKKSLPKRIFIGSGAFFY